MTIATYTDLVQRCQDWLFGRTDIAARVPEFITLFEAKANRKLLCRQMENRVTTTVNMAALEPEFIQLPTDFQTMRRVRVISGGVPAKPRLKFATGQQIDDLRALNPTPNVPVWFAIFGSQMELCPTPNAAYSIELVYRVLIPPLSATQPTNWLLTFAPDAYLYGVLTEAAPYLKDDERIPVWSAGAGAAIADLNALNDEAEFNAGPLVMRKKKCGYS